MEGRASHTSSCNNHNVKCYHIIGVGNISNKCIDVVPDENTLQLIFGGTFRSVVLKKTNLEEMRILSNSKMAFFSGNRYNPR